MWTRHRVAQLRVSCDVTEKRVLRTDGQTTLVVAFLRAHLNALTMVKGNEPLFQFQHRLYSSIPQTNNIYRTMSSNDDEFSGLSGSFAPTQQDNTDRRGESHLTMHDASHDQSGFRTSTLGLRKVNVKRRISSTHATVDLGMEVDLEQGGKTAKRPKRGSIDSSTKTMATSMDSSLSSPNTPSSEDNLFDSKKEAAANAIRALSPKENDASAHQQPPFLSSDSSPSEPRGEALFYDDT